MRSYNSALIESYSQVPEVDGYVWMTNRSTRTCLTCLALDQSEYERPEDIPGRHVQCRCTISPKPKNMYPSVQRYLKQRGTSEDWVRSQSPGTIRKMMPSERVYQEFMSGRLTLEDFVGRARSPVWGDSVYQLSGRQVLERAGV